MNSSRQQKRRPEGLKPARSPVIFANRVAPDVAFVAGLPARILAARATTDPAVVVSTVIATLSGAVRRGCDSADALANAVHLGHETSRVGARKEFEKVRHYIQTGDEAGLFETTLERVRTRTR